MLQRLLKGWRVWEDALTGIDDPHGVSLLGLEKRMVLLEAKMTELQESLSNGVKNPAGGASKSGD